MDRCCGSCSLKKMHTKKIVVKAFLNILSCNFPLPRFIHETKRLRAVKEKETF